MRSHSHECRGIASRGRSVGAYPSATGLELVRQHVAEYIARRDGHPALWQDVCISPGACAAIKNCLELFSCQINGKPSGVMVPVPGHPLYMASLTEYGLTDVDYYLDEEHGWSIEMDELERAFEEGRRRCNVRAIVVINPGNPTGQVLPRDNIEAVIEFAHRHGLFVFADEVYQDNVYSLDNKFLAFKKVLMELGSPYAREVQLASFMSVSKGYTGECGLRGGWMELVNLDEQVQATLYKAINAILCPDTLGQIAVDCVVRPPLPGEPSYDLWLAEKTAVLDSLRQRAQMIVDSFNSMEGFKCNIVQGAMYAFPRIELPPKALEAARAAGQLPDVFYASRLLEDTGICVAPGSEFRQRPGSHHLRASVLPPPAPLREMLASFEAFHAAFVARYS